MKLQELMNEASVFTDTYDQVKGGHTDFSLDELVKRIIRLVGGQYNPQGATNPTVPLITNITPESSKKLIRSLSTMGFGISRSTNDNLGRKIPHEDRLYVKFSSDLTDHAILYLPSENAIYFTARQ